MASQLSRAGTMQVTAKEGQNYLDRNLTEWKKPYLMGEGGEEENDGEEVEEESSAPTPKPKLSKHTTMKGTAKEAGALLEGFNPDEDAFTRNQQKKMAEIQAEKPADKKVKIAKAGTMVATAKEAKNLLGGAKLGDTRLETKAKGKRVSMKRVSTMAAAAADAKAVYGDLPTSRTRKRKATSAPAAKPPAMKRAGTMQNTAKEGKAFLKAAKKPAKKAAKKPAKKSAKKGGKKGKK